MCSMKELTIDCIARAKDLLDKVVEIRQTKDNVEYLFEELQDMIIELIDQLE